MLRGRYGFDQLSRALAFLSIALMVIRMFLPSATTIWMVLNIASLLCMAVIFLRMFSKNFEQRAKENAWFIQFWAKVIARFKQRGGHAKVVRHNPTFEERRKYKYFSCTQCAQRLRVPRGKGKLRITCTRCSNKFEIKS